MKPPIIVNEHGDVSFFASVAAAAAYLEPVDVRNGEYVVYDSSGSVLQVVPADPHVLILESPSDASDASGLLNVLRSFWQAASREAAPHCSLQELIQRSVQRFGYVQ